MRPTLIALATAWGPRFGGINTFNTELLKSLGIYQGRGFEVACVLPRVSAEEAKDAQDSCSLTLLGLNRPDDEFDPATLNHGLKQILAARGWQHPIWLGHDDKTGPLALQLRDALGGRAALVHHMAHGAYQGFKKGSSVSAGEKAEHQRQWFRQADVCLAVGPRLARELEDLLLNEAKPSAVHTLIPGLSDPVEYGVYPAPRMPSSFTGFVSGRLDDDRIKQGRLALRAFAQAVAEARDDGGPPALVRSPRMRMMGIDPAQEDALRGQVQTWADGMFQVDLLPVKSRLVVLQAQQCGNVLLFTLCLRHGLLNVVGLDLIQNGFNFKPLANRF